MFSYDRLRLAIDDMASKRAIVTKKARLGPYEIRVQPMDLVLRDGDRSRSVQLFVRVSLETGGRAGLPLRAYLRVQAFESMTGTMGVLQIKPGWPRTPIEFVLDILWYGVIIFPMVTFLLRLVEQPSRHHLLAFALFVFLFFADRIVVALLYRRGNETIRESLIGGLDHVEAEETAGSSEQVQDWLRDIDAGNIGSG